MKEDREESDGEEMEHESGDTEKSSSSSDSSDTDSDDSSDVNVVDIEKRRAECVENLSDLERQFSILREQLYRERMTQIETKLCEIRAGRAAEYLVPVDDLQESCRVRIEVAGVLRQYKLANIRNNFEAEEQASNQNFQSEKVLAMDRLREEIEDRVRMLEEDRNNVDITADLWALEHSKHKRHSWRRGQWSTEDGTNGRRKPVVVSGPYIVYMLHDADILEDWALIKKAASSCKRASDWSDGNQHKKESFRPKYQKDSKQKKESKYNKDQKFQKDRKLHFPLKHGQKLKLW